MSSKFRHAWMLMALAAVAAPVAPSRAATVPAQLPCVPNVTCQSRPACPNADAQQPDGGLAAIRHATLCLINVQRTQHGLGKLHDNTALRGVASRYARRMVALSFFDHVSPTGGTFLRRIQRSAYLHGARGYSLGENLAWGGGILATPRSIVRAWMNSPGHRANILSANYHDIGVGVAPGIPVAGGGAGLTYVNEFGKRS